MTNMINDWDVDLSESLPEDSLLACLVICTKIFHKPLSAEELTIGLPMDDGLMTPSLFIRAAEHSGYTAQISKREIRSLNNSLLPAVLLLKNQKSCVLLEITKNHTAKIIQPELGSGINEIGIELLHEEYAGYTLFIRPSFQFSSRSTEALASKPKHWFWTVMLKTWPVYSEVLIASFLVNVFALAVPLFVMNIYDRVVPNFAETTLWVLVVGIIMVFAFDVTLRMLRSYFVDMAAKKVDLTLSSSIFEQVLGIRMNIRPRSVGSFVNTVQSFEFFREFITSTTMTILIDFPFAIIYLFLIHVIGGKLVFIPLLSIPIILIAGFIIQIPMRRLTDESQKHAAEKQATLIETLSNIEIVKTMVSEGPLKLRYENLLNLAAKVGIKLRFYTNLNINYTYFIQQLTYILVIVFGVYLIHDGHLTTGGLIACAMLTSRALIPMGQIAGLLTRYHQAMSSLRSLEMVMKLEVEKPANKTFLHQKKLQGNIEFQGVSFIYPQQALPSLNKTTFRIKSGDKVGIIGRTGSGKSTIAKLILNLYQADKGNVFLDGRESNQIDPNLLRQQIGYVPQDVSLFYGTIRDNIIFGAPHVNSEKILRAAEISSLDKVLAAHPKGYDLQVGERGYNLSGGQRQLVAITRALLLDPPILLFDEPTSSMDDLTEQNMKNKLLPYLKDKTFILVTHKTSMLSLVDRLIVIDNGFVVASGPKEEIFKAFAEGKIKPYVESQ